MSDSQKSSIAQLLYKRHPQFNFAKLVGELDTQLDRCPSTHRSMVWDCEDVAIFEIDDTRIIFGHTEANNAGYQTCLTIAVGPKCDGAEPSAVSRRQDGLCQLIAERMQERYPTDGIMWHETMGPITSEMIDNLNDSLPWRDDLEQLRKAPQATHKTWSRVSANDNPPLPDVQQDQLHRVRTALYPDAERQDRPTTQMRIAAHTLNSTLIIVSLPVGAALLTYSLLRGEDIQLSARAMALTGTLLGLSQSPLAQHLSGII